MVKFLLLLTVVATAVHVNGQNVVNGGRCQSAGTWARNPAGEQCICAGPQTRQFGGPRPGGPPRGPPPGRPNGPPPPGRPNGPPPPGRPNGPPPPRPGGHHPPGPPPPRPGGRPGPPPPPQVPLTWQCQNENGIGCRNTDPQENKRMVLEFYQRVFGNKEFDVLEQYVADDLIAHNPLDEQGIEGLRLLLSGPLGQGPPVQMDFKRSAAEGDLVWIHTRFPVHNGPTFALADIFRVNCEGKIQEHWDVMQDTNVTTTNPHPFF